MQVNLVGFMDKHGAAAFMEQLWGLLLSAQATVGGVPAEVCISFHGYLLFQANCQISSLQRRRRSWRRNSSMIDDSRTRCDPVRTKGIRIVHKLQTHSTAG